MIIRKILKRDHVKIFTVIEAMEQMRADGITDVIIQPTHVINGIENDLMKEHALSFHDAFRSIRFGTPLLTSEADNRAVIAAVTETFSSLSPKDALVLMGHGTTHYSNAIYAALDYQFKEMGYPNIFVGTVEAYPDMDTLLRLVDQTHPEQIYLAPFYDRCRGSRCKRYGWRRRRFLAITISVTWISGDMHLKGTWRI